MDDATVMKAYGNTDLPAGTKDRPLVTFALFAYNQEKYVREAVEGAFAQTYSPLEIILSDDCSSDRTFEIMEEMAAAYRGPHCLQIRKSKVNLGLADHINEVIANSRGELISWAAGDDVAYPQRTELLAEKILENMDIVGSHSNVEEIDLDGRHIRVRFHTQKEYETDLRIVVAYGQSVITQSHAFRRIAFEKFGPFRSDLTQEGIAMAFREASLGRVAFLEQPLTKYRMGSGTSTYSGRDIRLIKKDEPTKYANWYLSAFRQMRDDAEKIPELLSQESITRLEQNISFYASLVEINSGGRIFTPLIRNFWIARRDTKSIRAVVRRLLPSSFYGFIKR